MSISGAMNAAITGLRAAARGSELVSNNIANALTPTYGRRELELSSLTSGSGGVRIDAVSRHMNEGIVADRRIADAEQRESQAAVDFFRQVEDIVGIPGSETGLNSRLAAFESSLISAASRPDSTERLAEATADARRLVEGIQQASASVQHMRSEADIQIGRDVETLNTALGQVEKLNAQIAVSLVRTGDAGALLDQRQAVLDTIGSIVPIRVLPRDGGNIAIYSEGGAILLDGTAAEIGFSQQNTVTAYQTREAGTLSGLSMNGQEIRLDALAGGSLGASFAVRDDYGVEVQSKLDALARDMVERFQDASVDATRAAGDPGLFTDQGTAFDPTNEVGIASRIQLNTAVDPNAGGAVWRLRDGLGAALPGAAGDAGLINDLRSALQAPRDISTGPFGPGSYAANDLLSTFGGALAASRSNAEAELSFASARFTELTELQLSQGVDTDQELQNLLVLEQAYAANARVIQAADDMLETLMRI